MQLPMSHPLGGGGLFGRPKKRKPFDMGAPDYTMPTGGPQYEDMPTGLGMSAPQKPKGRSIVPYLLAAAEDTLSRQMGYQPGGVARLNEQREREAIFQQRAMEQAAKQRAEAQKLAEQRAYDRRKFLFENEYERNNPKPTGTQANVEWWTSLTPEQQAEYSQALDQLDPIQATTWQGPTTIPRKPPIGAKISMSDLGGPAQGGPTIRNTPAPELGANGLPTTLTRDQYEAVVQARGRAATEEWARRHNIRVVN